MALLVDLDNSLLSVKSPIFHQANARDCWNRASFVCRVNSELCYRGRYPRLQSVAEFQAVVQLSIAASQR